MSSILDSDDEKQPGPAFGPVSSDSSDDDVSPQKYRSPSDGSSSSSDISSDDGNHMKSENHRQLNSSDEEDEEDFSRQNEEIKPTNQETNKHVMPELSSSSDDDSDGDDNNANAGNNQPTGIILHPDSDEDKSEDDFDGKEKEAETISVFRPHTTISNTKVSLLKLPQYVRIDAKPFHKDYFDDRDFVGNDALVGKISTENVIRWKYENGDSCGKKISNAKIVRWSDGTTSLRIGKKFFDVVVQKESGANHCFMRLSSYLFGQAAFKDKVTFRTLEKNIPVISRNKGRNKPQTVKILQEDEIRVNPEVEQAKLKKIEEEKLRAAQRRENQQRRIREKPRYTGLSSKFLERNGESLNAIKNRYAQGNYSSSEDESDDDYYGGTRKLESDDEEEDTSGKNKKDLKKKKVVIEDDED
ncbi:RNA polymerase-associated protein LEO1 [Strongyloides ratti]|uniref:RNA polymerase-associated protein LEO1 n=1 Tax=Strongyloides ratti TaxID=34506 RepID=A0A090LCW0_STRRB|nr:RNA polymerase-associated protein LEO1 [Strongyloides ratti]CEF65963.1 RNA polymerase-associated protein LEO1 [Strongyloides ratti]